MVKIRLFWGPFIFSLLIHFSLKKKKMKMREMSIPLLSFDLFSQRYAFHLTQKGIHLYMPSIDSKVPTPIYAINLQKSAFESLWAFHSKGSTLYSAFELREGVPKPPESPQMIFYWNITPVPPVDYILGPSLDLLKSDIQQVVTYHKLTCRLVLMNRIC